MIETITCVNNQAAARPVENTEFLVFAKNILKQLHCRLGFALWMITRTEGEDWIVLEAEDHGYGLQPPALFRWTDSFCSRMVKGLGPRVAPDAAAIPAYANSPIAQQVPIGAYIGIPLTWPDGSLFGTLCAIDPKPQPASIEADLPFVELVADMLGMRLAHDVAITELSRNAERARIDMETDALTGLLNRRGWDRLLALEEDRCRNYGNSAGIVMLDLDDLKIVNDTYGHAAGDKLLKKAASTLRSNVRDTDIVARIGGDEFIVLLTSGSAQFSQQMPYRLRSVFDGANLPISIGMAVRNPLSSLDQAVNEADSRMYDQKRRRKNCKTLEYSKI